SGCQWASTNLTLRARAAYGLGVRGISSATRRRMLAISLGKPPSQVELDAEELKTTRNRTAAARYVPAADGCWVPSSNLISGATCCACSHASPIGASVAPVFCASEP